MGPWGTSMGSGHIVTKAVPRGFPLVAPKKWLFTPAGSKSIRRNSDLSPIALLVDHENSIHTRTTLGQDLEFGAFGSHRNHVFVTRPPSFDGSLY
jgi:hypothetical protein